jgi:hypothetical protein
MDYDQAIDNIEFPLEFERVLKRMNSVSPEQKWQIWQEFLNGCTNKQLELIQLVCNLWIEEMPDDLKAQLKDMC